MKGGINSIKMKIKMKESGIYRGGGSFRLRLCLRNREGWIDEGRGMGKDLGYGA